MVVAGRDADDDGFLPPRTPAASNGTSDPSRRRPGAAVRVEQRDSQVRHLRGGGPDVLACSATSGDAHQMRGNHNGGEDRREEQKSDHGDDLFA